MTTTTTKTTTTDAIIANVAMTVQSKLVLLAQYHADTATLKAGKTGQALAQIGERAKTAKKELVTAFTGLIGRTACKQAVAIANQLCPTLRGATDLQRKQLQRSRQACMKAIEEAFSKYDIINTKGVLSCQYVGGEEVREAIEALEMVAQLVALGAISAGSAVTTTKGMVERIAAHKQDIKLSDESAIDNVSALFAAATDTSEEDILSKYESVTAQEVSDSQKIEKQA